VKVGVAGAQLIGALPLIALGCRMAHVKGFSLWSEASFLSVGSRGSFLSIGSVGSALSIGSVGSFASAFSIGSAGSLGSVLSASARASVLSQRASGALLGETENGRAATLLTGVLVAFTAGCILQQRRVAPKDAQASFSTPARLPYSSNPLNEAGSERCAWGESKPPTCGLKG
jgi:hypothetical protein